MKLLNPVKAFYSYQLLKAVKNFEAIKALELINNKNQFLDINFKDSKNKTPLYYAQEINQKSLVLALLNNGALPHFTYTDKTDETLEESFFHMSARNVHYSIIDFLILNFPELILTNNTHRDNPFDISIKLSNASDIALFINYFDANPHQLENLKNNPKTVSLLAHYCIQEPDYEKAKVVFKFLEKHNLRAYNERDFDPSLKFFRIKSPEAGKYKNISNKTNNSFLMDFCLSYSSLMFSPKPFPGQEYDLEQMAKLRDRSVQLYKKNVEDFGKKFDLFINSPFTDLNAQNDDGKTAIMFFWESRLYDFAHLLLEQPRNSALLKNKDGETIVDFVSNRFDLARKASAPFLEKAKIILEAQFLSSNISPPSTASISSTPPSHSNSAALPPKKTTNKI